MKPALLILGAWFFYRLGKEAADQEWIAAYGVEVEQSFEEAQRQAAPNQ